jgi:U3 small nucleolar RNA-associated protein 22
VQPLSAVARGTAPLPPQPHPLAGGSAAAAVADAGGVGGIPRCLDPLEVLVTLENSGEQRRGKGVRRIGA